MYCDDINVLFLEAVICWLSCLVLTKLETAHVLSIIVCPRIPLLVFRLCIFMCMWREYTSQLGTLGSAAQPQHDYPWPRKHSSSEAYTITLIFYLHASSSTLSSSLLCEWLASFLRWLSGWRHICHLIMSHVVYWSPAASLQEKENTCCLSSVKHKKPRSYLVFAGGCMCLPYYSQALNRHSGEVTQVWDDFAGKLWKIIMGYLLCTYEHHIYAHKNTALHHWKHLRV